MLRFIRTKTQNFRRDARRWGQFNALSKRVMTRLGRMFGISVNQVWVRRLGTDLPHSSSRSDIDCREVSIDELLAYPMLDELKLTKSYLHRIADCGLRAIAAYDGSRLVGYVFGTIGGGPVTKRVFVETDPESVYVLNVFVHEDYRGQRIAPALVRFGDYLLHLKGIETGVGYVSISNLASRRSSGVTNSKVVGYAGYIELGGFFFPFRSPGARKVNFKFLKRVDLIA